MKLSEKIKPWITTTLTLKGWKKLNEFLNGYKLPKHLNDTWKGRDDLIFIISIFHFETYITIEIDVRMFIYPPSYPIHDTIIGLTIDDFNKLIYNEES